MPEFPSMVALATLRTLRLSPVYKWAYGTVSKESFVSIEKAEKVLGFKPRYSNKAALLRNYEWYLANLHRFEGASGVTHRVPWSQGVLTIAKRFFSRTSNGEPHQRTPPHGNSSDEARSLARHRLSVQDPIGSAARL